MIIEDMKKELKIFIKENPIAFFCLVLYLVILLIYLVIYILFFADRNAAMTLNELGDFLAGTFSPLAFLFLYLGYKQNSKSIKIQTDELRLSNEALNQQIEEMKNSVVAQQNMFELAEKQYADIREEKVKSLIPKIILIGSKYSHIIKETTTQENRFTLTLKVMNMPINNIKIRNNFWDISTTDLVPDNTPFLEISSLPVNTPFQIWFFKNTSDFPFINNTLSLEYYSENGRKYTNKYLITVEAGIVIFTEIFESE